MPLFFYRPCRCTSPPTYPLGHLCSSAETPAFTQVRNEEGAETDCGAKPQKTTAHWPPLFRRFDETYSTAVTANPLSRPIIHYTASCSCPYRALRKTTQQGRVPHPPLLPLSHPRRPKSAQDGGRHAPATPPDRRRCLLQRG